MDNLVQSGIYAIEHTASGKKYIGSAVCLDERFKRHKRHLNRGDHVNPKLQHAWTKYGECAFEFRVLLLCEVSELLDREQEFMDANDVVNSGYNIVAFARNPNHGKKISEETREKMKASQKNRPPISEETREKLRIAAKAREAAKKAAGYEVSEETRKKLSEASKGRVFSEECLNKRREKLKGIPLSEEHRQKLSDANKGLKQSDETKEKKRQTMKEKWQDPEFREKMAQVYAELKENKE